jgi:hypothetical protein
MSGHFQFTEKERPLASLKGPGASYSARIAALEEGAGFSPARHDRHAVHLL